MIEQEFELQEGAEVQGDEGLSQIEELEMEKAKEGFKLFGLYDVSEVKVNDPGMKKYINLEPKLSVKSHGRIREKFGKAKVNVLEVFANLIAVPGHRGKKHKIQTAWKTGKYSQNMKIVMDTLKIIEEKLKINPVQVLVSAIENAAPRDGVTIIEYGGARYPQAVDISPLRRFTMTLRYIVHGSYDKSFNKKTKIERALADEIVKAYNGDGDSYSMSKKKDSEKQADSAR
ncbi:30S ribosomal protein S7 [Candidatus Pacearchaeota archaeon]|nr:30S ribosomal protein S7 [Candidatus Pacearchaeota archaeon]